LQPVQNCLIHTGIWLHSWYKYTSRNKFEQCIRFWYCV